jgi:hypothetical protein
MKWKRVISTTAVVMLVVLRSLSVKAVAADISVSITNENNSDLVVFVYDLYGGGARAVDGSPFSLAAGQPRRDLHFNQVKMGTARSGTMC